MAWHSWLCADLQNLGFDQLSSGACVFMKRASNGGVIFLLVYMYYIIIMLSSRYGVDFVVNEIKKLYKVRVNDCAEWFLREKLQWISDDNIQLNQLLLLQPLSTDSIIQRFRMTNLKAVFTPIIEPLWTAIQSESYKSVVAEQLDQQITS